MVMSSGLGRWLAWREDVTERLIRAADRCGWSFVCQDDARSTLSRYLTFATRRGVVAVVRISDHSSGACGVFKVSRSLDGRIDLGDRFRRWLAGGGACGRRRGRRA